MLLIVENQRLEMQYGIWIVVVLLFMELLGSSTQEWLIVGGTRAGQEIFTNFLSSVMNHATWPLILNEWVQRKTEGYGDTGINDI
jgi:hypothetical protein